MTALAESFGSGVTVASNADAQVGDQAYIRYSFTRNRIATESRPFGYKKVSQEVEQYFLGRIAAIPQEDSTIMQRGLEIPLAPAYRLTDVRLIEESRRDCDIADTEFKDEISPDIIFQPGRSEYTLLGILRDGVVPGPRNPRQ